MDIRVIKGVKIYWEIDKIKDFFCKKCENDSVLRPAMFPRNYVDSKHTTLVIGWRKSDMPNRNTKQKPYSNHDNNYNYSIIGICFVYFHPSYKVLLNKILSALLISYDSVGVIMGRLLTL